jgi:hypothetical protein
VCDLRAPVAVWDVFMLGPLKAVLLWVPLQAQDGVLLRLNGADVHLQVCQGAATCTWYCGCCPKAYIIRLHAAG